MVSAVERQSTGPRSVGNRPIEMLPTGSQAVDDQEDSRYELIQAKARPCRILTLIYRPPNPLALLTHGQVLGQAEDFVTQKGLGKHMRLFKTAALVAQGPAEADYGSINALILAHPAAYEGVRPIEEEELDALKDELRKRWKHPRELYWTIVLCSVGAIVQ